MVRAFSAPPGATRPRFGRARIWWRLFDRAWHVSVLVLVVISGCAIVPGSRIDECQKLAQSLRADNAHLKDRVLALQGQNRDYAERAVDDARRLAVQDEAIERLEHSVQAYQDERTRLEAAYKQLVSNLGVAGPDGETARGEAPDTTPPPRVSRWPAGTDAGAPR
jgi:uncharacterized coiled-coil protein SlyX